MTDRPELNAVLAGEDDGCVITADCLSREQPSLFPPSPLSPDVRRDGEKSE